MRQSWLSAFVLLACFSDAMLLRSQYLKDPLSSGSTASPLPNGESSPGEHYYCRSSDMPISWATAGSPVEVVHSSAVFTELGTVVPELDVRNTQASTITSLAFVIEYLNGKGEKVTTAAIAGAASGIDRPPVPFSVEGIEQWKEPIEPGKIVRVTGFYDSVRTVTCPESGRITFVMAVFKNGAVKQYAEEGWSVPPLPRSVPELTAACPTVRENPSEIQAKIHINSMGDVVGVSATPPTRDNAGQVSWIATQLKEWKFQPLLLNGKAQEADLDVRFVIYGTSEPDLGAISPSSPATLILFVPRKEPGRGCMATFGFLHDASTTP